LTLNAFNLDFIGSVHTSRITAAGRFLLGTTTESTFIFDAVGTARVSSFTDIGSGTDSTANPNSYIFKVWGSQRITGDIQLTGAAGSGRVIEFSNGIVKISPTTYSGGGTSSVSIQGFASGNAAIGIGGTASNTQSIAIGNASLASGIYGVAIGSGTLASGTSSVAIGVSSSAEAGEFVCGYPYDIGVTNVYFGSGKIRKAGSTTVNGAGISYAINGSGAAGTDFAGGNITIAGGKGTGTGTSGDVIISTATPTTTGTILQSLTSRWWVKGSTGTLSNVASPNASAQFQIDSTTKGFLPPRMTTTQKNAIGSPAAGLMVYDTTLNKLCVYTTAWETITSL
jgi:hypothetical protein